jgi:hypothetical protein
MSEKEYLWLAKMEKMLTEKYGPLTVASCRKFWSQEKERSFLEQEKELIYLKNKSKLKDSLVEKESYLVNQKLLSKDTVRECQVCNVYSFEMRDNLYMNKFNCCFGCYIQWIEGREERWQKGWRP